MLAAFDYNGVHARTSGEVRASSPIGLAGTLHFDAQPPGQPAWTVNARIDGTTGAARRSMPTSPSRSPPTFTATSAI
jgi:hypothetical protein